MIPEPAGQFLKRAVALVLAEDRDQDAGHERDGIVMSFGDVPARRRILMRSIAYPSCVDSRILT
jgi:hypothetical protein